MNSPVRNLILIAACSSLPLLSLAQRPAGGTVNRPDVTLLTGPYLLSPASPPKSPMPNQEWVFIKGHRAAAADPLAEGATKAEVDEARQKLIAAEERLRRLRAERDAALDRKKELDQKAAAPAPTPVLPRDPIRFDAKMPGTPTKLVPDQKTP